MYDNMKSGRSGPRSKQGCWTCRGRKVKCDEHQPVCKTCEDRGLNCDYEPRPKPPRRRRVDSLSGAKTSPVHPHSSPGAQSLAILSPLTPQTASTVRSAVTQSPAVDTSFYDLPHGLAVKDWPFPLSLSDCQAIWHYTEVFIPRMVLKTPRWSSYAFMLFLCTKHELLAHLVLAFAVKDMARGTEGKLEILAIEHYRVALSMFIEHLGLSDQNLWLTFPALWLFIHYEQAYGDDPRVLQRHLEGVRDVVAAHGHILLPGSAGGLTTIDIGGEQRPRQIIDRMALWTIYHDASASTFGFGGGLIQLLQEQYPGSISRIQDSSSSMVGAAWGKDYPAEEKLWDQQIAPMENLSYDCILWRYQLSKVDKCTEETVLSEELINIGIQLKKIEKDNAHMLLAAANYHGERDFLVSNYCVLAALLYSLQLCYEKKVYKTRPFLLVSKTLKACASLYEHEGVGYMWRVAWPMFIAALETDDPIYQNWVMDRFTALEAHGENMRRAKVLLEAICHEQRIAEQSVDWRLRIRRGQFQAFVI